MGMHLDLTWTWRDLCTSSMHEMGYL